MSAAEGWDDSWKRYPQLPDKQEALRRIQAAILGRNPPEPIPQKAAPAGPTDPKTPIQTAGQQPPDLDDAPTLSLPKTVKQDQAAEPDGQTGTDAENARKRSAAKPILIACCALLTAAAIAGAVNGGRAYMGRRAYDSAMESCTQARHDVEAAYRTPYARAYRAALSVNPGQVKDPKTVQRLHALAGRDKGPAPLLACKAGDGKDALNASAGRMHKAASRQASLNGKVKAAAQAVLASRDAKVLDDAKAALDGKKGEASRLLADSDGKVADNATRDALQQAIDQAGQVKGGKAKAYQDAAAALQSAMDQVNASVQAKSQADQQAAAQAAQQAQQQYAAQQQAAPSYRGGGGYTPSYRPSYNRGGGGGGSAPAPAAPAPAPAAPPAPQGGWSVPPATGDDNSLPDHL